MLSPILFYIKHADITCGPDKLDLQAIQLNYAWVLLAVHTVLAVSRAGHALLYKKDQRAALGWIAVSFAYSIVGPLLYYLFGINRLRTRAHHLKGAPHRRLKIGYERADNVGTTIADKSLLALDSQPALAALARSSAAVTHRPKKHWRVSTGVR